MTTQQIESMLKADNHEKRKASSGAHHQKKHKDRAPHMSTDNMSRKQWENMNGEIYVFSMNRPCNFVQLRSQSPDIIKEYISKLVQRFNSSAFIISRMLGIAHNTFYKFIDKHKIGNLFNNYGRVTKSQKEAWNAWLKEFSWPIGYFDMTCYTNRSSRKKAAKNTEHVTFVIPEPVNYADLPMAFQFESDPHACDRMSCEHKEDPKPITNNRFTALASIMGGCSAYVSNPDEVLEIVELLAEMVISGKVLKITAEPMA